MDSIEFKAVVVCNELNLGNIAQHFGIYRKFRWEDLLKLTENELKGIIKQPENKVVYIFHFGSLVFINCEHHDIMDILQYLKRIEKNVNTANLLDYSDDYKLEINAEESPALNNDFMVAAELSDHHLEIVSTVLAKSVALEKTEKAIDLLLDEIEEVVTYLNQGQLTTSDSQLAKLSAKVLGFKLNTLSYIMLLDKPDITWVNEAAESMFIELSSIFELEDRYGKLRQKSDTLLDITQVFSTLAHAKRGNRLEWAVIILIAIEIVLSLYEMFVMK
jgi:uncharacterized Rmd1/YagE family protein